MDAIAELEAVGLTRQAAGALAALIATAPFGAFDAEDTPATRRHELALHAALVASLESRRFSVELQILLEWLEGGLSELSRYDMGRCAHLRGVASWRLDNLAFLATRSFNTSSRLLVEEGTPRARRYLARVYDSSGQLLHQQGLLADARRELTRALALRESLHDTTGEAITLGNLGRLCMHLGDFGAAVTYLDRDLAIVEQNTPGLTRVQGQLHSHLGDCKLHLGAIDSAAASFARSAELARGSGDAIGGIFADLGAGRVQLARADAPGALLTADDLLVRVAALDVQPQFRAELRAAAKKLAGDAHLAGANYDAAIAAYRVSAEGLTAGGGSPIEHAEIYRGLALALFAKLEAKEASEHLRQALRRLDATAADDLRSRVEAELKSASYDAWLLHSAGRFIGQHHIEYLLSEAGHDGFRGTRRRVIVLFSDLRGFTTMSEHLDPEALILVLNDFLTLMTRCIERHGGMVDKFIGDAVMAIFPYDDARAGDDAIAAALAMRDELERFNRRLGEEGRSLSIGIGLHAGEVVAGLIGSPQKRDYTVLGDVVNAASRLESMTKQVGATLLVSAAVLDAADATKLLARPLGTYAPKGRTHGITVFDIHGVRDRSPSSRAHDVEIARCKDALAMFTARDFRRAADAFAALEKDATGTGKVAGYHLLATKSREFAATPPPVDWAGDIHLVDK